jgi:serine/threonine protein kinase
MFGARIRCPKGYSKIDILGKGGCAIVWLCKKEDTHDLVAIKQFPKARGNEINFKSSKEEIKINRLFFGSDGSTIE